MSGTSLTTMVLPSKVSNGCWSLLLHIIPITLDRFAFLVDRHLSFQQIFFFFFLNLYSLPLHIELLTLLLELFWSSMSGVWEEFSERWKSSWEKKMKWRRGKNLEFDKMGKKKMNCGEGWDACHYLQSEQMECKAPEIWKGGWVVLTSHIPTTKMGYIGYFYFSIAFERIG